MSGNGRIDDSSGGKTFIKVSPLKFCLRRVVIFGERNWLAQSWLGGEIRLLAEQGWKRGIPMWRNGQPEVNMKLKDAKLHDTIKHD